MDKASVSFTVNGRAVAATLDPRTLLVHFLREELKLTGTHIGCDTSQCGASWRATSAGARAITTSSRPSPPAPGRCGATRAGAKRAAKGRGMYPFTYHRPVSLDDAKALLAGSEDGRPLAGGMSLLPTMRFRLTSCADLVDLNGIGALARHNEVKHSPLVRDRCPLLTEAYDSIAHHTVRNRGTLGGNLCHADPSSETPTVMIAAGATLVLRSLRGSREVGAADFFLGTYETAARQDEMLVEIRIPGIGADGWAFAEISNRHGDFAIAALTRRTVRRAAERCG